MNENDDDYIKQRDKALAEAEPKFTQQYLFILGFQQGFARGFRFGEATKFYCKRCGIFLEGGTYYCDKCSDIILKEIDLEFGGEKNGMG